MPLFRWPMVLLLPCRSHKVKEIWVDQKRVDDATSTLFATKPCGLICFSCYDTGKP
ncbi:hypothetical protein Hanom_Chr12g01079731 [Helianthus anomalus]